MDFLRLALPGLSLCLLASCASVSVKDERLATKQPAQKPAQIYVADFRTDKGSFKADGKDGKDLEAFQQRTVTILSTRLVKELEAHVAPARRATDVGKLPRKGWLVTGTFERVNPGSRWLRVGIGLGAGGTKMETRVAVYDLASGRKPFLTFATTGGSNAMPGMIISSSPLSVALNIIRQANRGVPDDCARTSRMVAGVLNEYLVDRQWLPDSRRFSAKRLGQYQLLHEHFMP